MFVFGSGVLIGTQLNVPTSTPINFGLVQKVSVNTSVGVKELYGQYAFPVAVGSGTRKVQWQGLFGAVQRPGPWSPVLQSGPDFGLDDISVLLRCTAFRPRARIPSRSPTPLISSPTKASSMRRLGLPLLNVATLTAAAQYTFNASTGVYTFYLADAGAGVLISYTYSSTATTTQNLAIANPLIGPTSTFAATLFATDPTTNAPFSVTLNQCVASKFSFDTNIEDFAKPDFEFQAFANAAGQVMTFNFGDAA